MNNSNHPAEAIREASSESPLNPQTPSQNSIQNSVNITQATNLQPAALAATLSNPQSSAEAVPNPVAASEAPIGGDPTGNFPKNDENDQESNKDGKNSEPVPRPPQSLATVFKDFFKGRGYPTDIPSAASLSTQLIASNPPPPSSSFQNTPTHQGGYQSNALKEGVPLTSINAGNPNNNDEFTELLRHHALSSHSSDYPSSYNEFRNWVHNSLELYKTELSSLLYPIFVHSYLDLVERQEIEEARNFYERFSDDHTTYFSEDLQKFKTLTLSSNPMDHELVKTFRGNKFGVKLSQNGFKLLIGYLLESQFLLNLRIINKWVNVVLTDATPNAGDPRGSYIGITGHVQQELNQFNQEKIYLGRPPIAPELKHEVELLAKEEDQASNTNKEDPNAEKPKPKEGEVTPPTTSTNQYKDPKSNSLLNTLKRYYDEIDPESSQMDELPLPPQKGTDAKREIEFIKDLRHRITLGTKTKALPSICCYTWHNTNHNVNCTTLSDNLGLMAIGTRDSYIGLYSLLNEPLRSLKGTINPAMVKDASDLNRMRERGINTNRKLVGHSGPIFGMSFSQDNQYLISGSEDKTVRLWSLETYQTLVVYKGHNFPIWDVDFSPTSYYFATASLDRTSRLWSTDHPSPLRVFTGHLSDVDCVKFHPNSRYVMTGSTDKTARLWDVNRGSCVRVFTGHTSPIYKIAVSPDGKSMATSGIDNSIMVWDLGTGKRSYHFELGTTEATTTSVVHSLEFSADSNVLFSAGNDCSIKVWDVKSSIDNVPADMNTNGFEMNGDSYSKPKGLLSEFSTKGTPIKYLKCTRRNLLLGVGTFNA